MLKRPNFYLLCIVKVPQWRHRLVVPVPLFLVDEVLAVASWGIGLARFTSVRTKLKGVDLDKAMKVIEGAWRSIRQAGSFTLAEVTPGDGTHIQIRIL